MDAAPPVPPPTLRHRRQLKLAQWPTPDWEFTPWSYRALKTVLETPIKVAGRVRHRGVEHVPERGGVLLAVNHHSWSDPFVLGAVLPRPAFYLAKERLFRNKALAAFLEAHGQIKVDREKGGNDAAVTTATGLLDGGFVVGIFPEGTRSRPHEVKRGRLGVARIALRSGAPVVPVGMTTYSVWPKHRALPRFGDRVYVKFGTPRRYAGGSDAEKKREELQRVTDEIMGDVEACLKDAEDARRRGDAWDA